MPKSAVQITLEVDFVGRHVHWKDDDDLWHPLNDLSCRGDGKQGKNEDDPAMARHWMDYKLGKLIADRSNAEGVSDIPGFKPQSTNCCTIPFTLEQPTRL